MTRTARFGRAVGLPPVSLADAALEMTGVTVRYGDFCAPDAVDLTLKAGEIVAVVGPNGAGKSTMLGVLSGDITPQHGLVDIDGAPIGSWTHRELALRRAVLLQRIELSFPFTVTEVVRMGRGPWAATDAEDDDDIVVADAMVATDVLHLADRFYTTLSGGEQARVAFARVLAQQTQVLLLDEPTAALDVRHQEQVLVTARSRADHAGVAVAVVMHDLAAAAAYADRVVVLAEGRVRASGTPEDVFTPELLTEVWEYPIDVVPHPQTGDLIVVPHRWQDS
jgi:iron complex transport system ATP-binding protein